MIERYLDVAKTDEWFVYRGLDLHESFRQEYSGNNCVFAAGVVGNPDPPVDTIYLCVEKDGGGEYPLLLLRPDEATAIAIALNAAVWTKQVEGLHEHD